MHFNPKDRQAFDSELESETYMEQKNRPINETSSIVEAKKIFQSIIINNSFI